jgi:peroxiredoxin
MKLLKFVLVLFVMFGFAGCLDVNEKIDVNKDGSGTYTMDMDLSQMLDLLQQYMGKE